MKDHDFYALATTGIVVLSASFLLLVLFGFFEDRKNGGYRFRFRRLILTIAVILSLDALLACVALLDLKSVVEGASITAEKVLDKNRVGRDYVLQNLGTMFPDILNDKTKDCYRAGLSNYVENEWDMGFHGHVLEQNAAFCQVKPEACVDRQDDYYEAIRANVNPSHILANDFNVIGEMLKNVWATAADSYANARQLFREPDSKGNLPPQPSGRMLAGYRHYITECASYKPLPWVTPGESLTRSKAHVCLGECP